MYRFYRTPIDYVEGMKVPDPEPDNWLGYEVDGDFILKTQEKINAEELSREDIREHKIESWKMFDQFI